MKSTSQYLSITAGEANLPQEVAQVILRLETVLQIDQETLIEDYLSDDVYSAEEEQLLQEHLRSLGYL